MIYEWPINLDFEYHAFETGKTHLHLSNSKINEYFM